ncbi:MAG: hypothetical protein HN348_27415, partial [Proteobacteria bacterium]|nr:hypothetical protein [Pseudomonadota bacterium]
LQCDWRDAERVFINSYGGGNFLTVDGGETWMVSSKGYTGAQVKGIAPSASTQGRVYVRGMTGPFASQNGGNDWEGLGYGPATGEGGSIVVDPNDDLHLLLAGPDGYFESFDGGMEWQMIESNVFSQIGLMPPSEFVFSPQDSDTVFALVADPDCFERGGQEGLSDGCPESDKVGLAVTRDGGQTWTKSSLESGHVISLAIAPGNGPMYAVVSGKGVFRSEDHGVSWTLANANPLNAEYFHAVVAVDHNDPYRVYLGSIEKGLGLSTDAGETWQLIAAGLIPEIEITDVVVDTAHADVVYASSQNAGIFFSKDGGMTWNVHNEGLTNRDVWCLALTADGGVLYAGTNGAGVFRLGSGALD